MCRLLFLSIISTQLDMKKGSGEPLPKFYIKLTSELEGNADTTDNRPTIVVVGVIG